MTDYNKRDLMILGLEQDPYDTIIWIVYNEDMVKGVRERFVQLRGEEYVQDNVLVVSPSSQRRPEGMVYFDPDFYDHIGNGQG